MNVLEERPVIDVDFINNRLLHEETIYNIGIKQTYMFAYMETKY